MGPTYDGVAPELGHLADPHGRQQDLPDLQLEHVADDDVHGVAHLLAVIYHRPLLITFHGSEMKGHLVTKRGDPDQDPPPKDPQQPPMSPIPRDILAQLPAAPPPCGALPPKGPHPTLNSSAGQEVLPSKHPRSEATDPDIPSSRKPTRGSRTNTLTLNALPSHSTFGLQKIPKAPPSLHTEV